MSQLEKLFDAIVDGQAQAARTAIDAELAQGGDPFEIITGTMIPAMDEVGLLYQEEQIFVPELMLSVAVIDAVRDFNGRRMAA